MLKALLDPRTLMLALAFGGGAWTYSRVSSALEHEQLSAELARATATKEAIQRESQAQREKDNANIQFLGNELANAQAQISLSVDAPCIWSPTERQLLNNPGSANAKARK